MKRKTWRTAVEKTTDLTLLSAESESTNPDFADQTIEAAVSQLNKLGQNPDYVLVKEENINYGFERNFYGLRWIGRLISFICCVVFVIALAIGSVHLGGQKAANTALFAGLIVDGLFLLGWLVLPSLDRTKDAADRYAAQLLDAVVTESRKDSSS